MLNGSYDQGNTCVRSVESGVLTSPEVPDYLVPVCKYCGLPGDIEPVFNSLVITYAHSGCL